MEESQQLKFFVSLTTRDDARSYSSRELLKAPVKCNCSNVNNYSRWKNHSFLKNILPVLNCVLVSLPARFPRYLIIPSARRILNKTDRFS